MSLDISKGGRSLYSRIIEFLIEKGLLVMASISIFTLGALIVFLLSQASPFFVKVPLTDFLFGTEWSPSSSVFGVLPLFVGTLLTSVVAAAIAIPIGIGCTIYLAEVAHPTIKKFLKPLIELLAGIPSIIFGLFAMLVLSHVVQAVFNTGTTLNGMVGAVALAIMMVPIMVTISEDAMNSVPGSLREASMALGATKWETIRGVLIPASLSGIVAAIILAFGRAIGETMTVLMATGSARQLTTNIFSPMETMTSAIALDIQEVARTDIQFNALFAVGLLLFVLTFLINLAASLILRKFREAYE
jgi:phosphate transport system permease protein